MFILSKRPYSTSFCFLSVQHSVCFQQTNLTRQNFSTLFNLTFVILDCLYHAGTMHVLVIALYIMINKPIKVTQAYVNYKKITSG